MCRYLQCMVPRRPNAKQLCTVCGAAPWRRTCIWPMDSQPTRNSPHILEPKYHYRIHKYPLSVSILSQLDPVHTPPHPTSWNVMSPFRCLGRTRVSVQVRGCCKQFVTGYVFTVRNCQHLAQPQAGGPPIVGYPRLLIQYIRSYPPYWRPFLHPQTEDATCRGDRDPLIMAYSWIK